MNIEEVLKALAAADAAKEAAPEVEKRLLEAYRRRRRRVLPWALVAAAAVVVLFVGWAFRVTEAPPAGSVAAVPRAPVEISTEFFPLLEIAPPFERGELVRVTVPAATMRRVGIPVREDRLLEPVQADILYGQEGLARAIRFVRLEQ